VKRLFFLSTATLALLASRGARAQVHYDVGVEGGASKHFLANLPDGASDASLGPLVMLQAHAAVLPMLRAGAYLGFETSPISGTPARRLYSGGLHLRLLPPFWRNPCTYTWLGLGLGYVGVYAPGFGVQVQDSNGQVGTATFDGAGGHYFELPISFGVARRIRKPWQVFAELGVRLGFAMSGSYYDGRPGHATLGPDLVTPPAGDDRFDVFLSVGIQLDQ
jgi:hypothetical protein